MLATAQLAILIALPFLLILFFLILTLRRRTAKLAETNQKLNNANRDLAETQVEFQTVFDGAPVGIGIWDRNLRYIRVNEELAQINGRSKEEHLGKTIPEIAPHMAKQLREATSRVFESAEAIRGIDLASETQPGVKRRWLCSLYPVRIGDETSCVAALCEEVTERKAAATALRATEQGFRIQTESLLRTNEDLEHFAFAASHDLQEPLRTILLYGQLIRQRHGEKLDPSVRSAVDNIVGGADRMTALLKDLRTLLKSGQAPIVTNEPVVTEDVLRDVLKDLKAAREEAGASVTYDLLPSLHADRAQLAQIFQNLISNALKYRGTAPPNVHVGAIREGSEWVFYVRDNGEGIEPEYQGKIFGAFQRLHGKRLPGSGLGLTICSRIVASYGGRIWLESKRGEGTTFFFTVPHAQVQEAAASD